MYLQLFEIGELKLAVVCPQRGYVRSSYYLKIKDDQVVTVMMLSWRSDCHWPTTTSFTTFRSYTYSEIIIRKSIGNSLINITFKKIFLSITYILKYIFIYFLFVWYSMQNLKKKYWLQKINHICKMTPYVKEEFL